MNNAARLHMENCVQQAARHNQKLSSGKRSWALSHKLLQRSWKTLHHQQQSAVDCHTGINRPLWQFRSVDEILKSVVKKHNVGVRLEDPKHVVLSAQVAGHAHGWVVTVVEDNLCQKPNMKLFTWKESKWFAWLNISVSNVLQSVPYLDAVLVGDNPYVLTL